MTLPLSVYNGCSTKRFFLFLLRVMGALLTNFVSFCIAWVFLTKLCVFSPCVVEFLLTKFYVCLCVYVSLYGQCFTYQILSLCLTQCVWFAFYLSNFVYISLRMGCVLLTKFSPSLAICLVLVFCLWKCVCLIMCMVPILLMNVCVCLSLSLYLVLCVSFSRFVVGVELT